MRILIIVALASALAVESIELYGTRKANKKLIYINSNMEFKIRELNLIIERM